MAISLYFIFDSETGKCYVGLTNDPKSRWKGHCRDAKRDKRPLYCAMRVRSEAFEFKVISIVSTLDEANQAERYWVKFFKSNDPNFGYNLTEGGDGITMTDETRWKISIAKKGKPSTFKGKHHTNEAKELNRLAHLGKSNHWKGKNVPVKMRQKISHSRTGKCLGDRNPAAKLVEVQVLEIKRLLKQGVNRQTIADMFSVSLSAIKAIKSGAYWSHVILDADTYPTEAAHGQITARPNPDTSK